jgi:hypothetical protein
MALHFFFDKSVCAIFQAFDAIKEINKILTRGVHATTIYSVPEGTIFMSDLPESTDNSMKISEKFSESTQTGNRKHIRSGTDA